MQTLIYSAAANDDRYRFRLGLAQALFLLSVVFAPLQLKLVASLTVYDVMVMIIAVLTIASGQRALEFPPAQLLAAAFVFVLFALLSAFRATYPLEALTQTLQFAFIFFIQLPVVLTVVKSPSMLRWSLLLLVLGTVLVTGWAMIFQEEGFHHRLRSAISENSNRLGYPTAYMMPFVLCLLIDYWRRRRILIVIFNLFVLYTMLWALSASGSRSAAVGTLIALMIFITFRHGINFKSVFRAFYTVTAIGVLGYLFYQSEYSGVLRERIQRTLMADDTLIGDRVRLAQAGWRSFLDSPLVGVGLDNFRHVATRFDVPSVTEQTPHNLWLQFLAQIGLIGTLGFLVVIAVWFLWLFWAQRVSNNQPQRDVLWAFIASMTSLMMIFMFIPIMIDRLYWLIYGLGLAAVFSSRVTPIMTMPEIPAQARFFPE